MIKRERALIPLLRLLVAVVVAVLACGSGLPGLLLALGDASAHVCTCASGSSHASCPVCNKTLVDEERSPGPRVDGAPCGDQRVATGVACDPGVLPAAFVGASPIRAYLRAPRAGYAPEEQRYLEPATPPPRSAST
jgi:hypothetical protein